MVQLKPSSTSSTMEEMAEPYSFSWVVSGGNTCTVRRQQPRRALRRSHVLLRQGSCALRPWQCRMHLHCLGLGLVATTHAWANANSSLCIARLFNPAYLVEVVGARLLRSLGAGHLLRERDSAHGLVAAHHLLHARRQFLLGGRPARVWRGASEKAGGFLQATLTEAVHRAAWHPRHIATSTPPPSRAAAHRQRRMTCTLAYTPSSPLAPPMALLARLNGLAAAIPGPLQLPFVSCRGLAGCRGPRGGWRAGWAAGRLEWRGVCWCRGSSSRVHAVPGVICVFLW